MGKSGCRNSQSLQYAIRDMKFIDLFAGIGGFNVALTNLGHECVFASEIDAELRQLYRQNFGDTSHRIVGDIRTNLDNVPAHDILAAGFPCQPFSKSGAQAGTRDQNDGTLFWEVIKIAKLQNPKYIILENVGNFARHDSGRTWKVVRTELEKLKYQVRGTEPMASGGSGLLSPHHLGIPQHRERFFAVASKENLPEDIFPPRVSSTSLSLDSIVQSDEEISETGIAAENALSEAQFKCIDHWNEFLSFLPDDEVDIPSFPLWADELFHDYQYEVSTPYLEYTGGDRRRNGRGLAAALEPLPTYARSKEFTFPDWKVQIIKQNRDWFGSIRPLLSDSWLGSLKSMQQSYRKFEWNCSGEDRDIWKHVIQFRPSGLRVKRYASSPALIAMTTSQLPILGPKRRFITRIEGRRLQGFPDTHSLPNTRVRSFKALGNAVNVRVAEEVASRLIK